MLDEADLWVPQRVQPDGYALLNRIEEIVRRGRIRGFVPWLITQRPAVPHKDVLSQADVLVSMKLTASQDRDAFPASAPAARASYVLTHRGSPLPLRERDRKSAFSRFPG